MYVADADIEAAFQYLAKPGADRVTLADLRAKLAPFFPEMPVTELRFLLGDAAKKDMSLAEVKALVRDNTIANFDPVAEAFHVFDMGRGEADLDVLRDVFEHAGFENMSHEDVKVLMQTADVDGDGRITLDDFRAMLSKASAITATGLTSSSSSAGTPRSARSTSPMPTGGDGPAATPRARGSALATTAAAGAAGGSGAS